MAAFHDGEPVSAATETVRRPDLTGIGWGAVAFTVRLTCASLETVQLRVARPGRPRRWTVIEPVLKRPIGQGAIDRCVGNHVRGWAACFLPEDRAFTVAVYAGSDVVARTRPCLPRPDAAESIAYGRAEIGFEASVPWRHLAFSRLAAFGETRDARFHLGDIEPAAMNNNALPQSFRYDRDVSFWR